jgi:Flp pilus assembly protein TadG
MSKHVRQNTEHGVSALELVIVVPLVAAGLALLQFGWTATACRGDVRFAANQAARAAARAQTVGGAQTATRNAANAVVADRQIPCRPPVKVFVKSDPVRNETITVVVTCEAELSKLSIVGIADGTMTATATGFEVVDRLRGGDA